MYSRIDNRDSRNAERQDCGRKGQFHEMVAQARYNGLPKLLAWVAAAITAVCMAIWGYFVYNDPQIILVIILFFIYRFVFRVIAGLVFLVLDLATRNSYTDTAKRFSDDAFDQSDSNSSYVRTEYRVQDDEYENARKMFRLPESFSREDLKRARNALVKSLHPDEGGDPEQFKTLMRAYELLSAHVE